MKPEHLSAPVLREIRLDALRGRLPPAPVVEALAEALEDALDAASCCPDVENPDSAAKIPEAVREIEKLRERAVQDETEAEAAHERKVAELEGDHETALEEERQKRLEMEKDLDEWRRRAEKAEHVLAESVRAGHGLDREATRREKDLVGRLREERTINDEAAVLLEELTAHVKVVEAENRRLTENLDRAADFWREKAREEIAVSLSAEVDARLAAEKARETAAREAWRLREALSGIVSGTAEEAWKRARVALGREVIRESGSEVREGYVPTRAERRKARGR